MFARDVHINGWTNVGDKLGGAYVGTSPLVRPVRCSRLNARGLWAVYDCVIRTKEVSQSPSGSPSLIDIIHSTRNSQSTTIHAHKRYSAFVELYQALRQSLPVRLLLPRPHARSSRRTHSPTNNTLSPRSPRNHPFRATDRRFLTTDGDSCSIGSLRCCCIPRLERVRR